MYEYKGDKMSLTKHAETEFRALGWLDENGKYCNEMQELMCTGLLDIIQKFGEQGHSGFSASYAIGCLTKLLDFKPLGPLTGEDWEWNDISEMSGYTLYQNKRCSTIFKKVLDDGTEDCYNIDGKVFWEWCTDPETGEKFKSHYTSSDSIVPVTFPYTVTEPEYMYRESENE